MLGSARRALRVPQDDWASNVTSVIRTAVMGEAASEKVDPSAAELAEMCRLGITVPSGFTISTETRITGSTGFYVRTTGRF